MQSKKKLIILSASFAPSIIDFRGDFIRMLLKSSIKVIVVAPEVTPEIRFNLETMGCEVHCVKLDRNKVNIFSDLRYLIQMLKLLIFYKPDALVSYTAKPNIYGSICSAILRRKNLMMITGLGYSFSLPQKTILLKIQQTLYAIAIYFSDMIIFQNSDDLKELIRLGILRQTSKARLVNGSGVDTKKFQPHPLPEKINFLMLSRFLKTKGILEYVEAAKKVRTFGYNVTFTLAGYDDQGPDSVRREDLIDKYGRYVKILNAVDDVRPLISTCSVYVLPSYREGTPRSVLEAMSMARPIITTDAPGCRETVINNENGYLVKVQSVDSLVSKLIKFCNNKNSIERMGLKSRELVLKKFESYAVTSQYLQHTLDLVGD